MYNKPKKKGKQVRNMMTANTATVGKMMSGCADCAFVFCACAVEKTVDSVNFDIVF